MAEPNWTAISRLRAGNALRAIVALNSPMGAARQPVFMPEITPGVVQALKNARIELHRAVEAAEMANG